MNFCFKVLFLNEIYGNIINVENLLFYMIEICTNPHYIKTEIILSVRYFLSKTEIHIDQQSGYDSLFLRIAEYISSFQGAIT